MGRSFAILFVFLLFLSGYSISQPKVDRKDKQPDMTGLFAGCIEQAPQTNWEKWTNYLTANLVLDSASLDTIQSGVYKAVIQFVIDKEGKIGEVSVWADPGYGLGSRAAKIIAQYKDSWQPATINGRPVKSFRMQPVTFVVEEEEAEDKECREQLPAGSTL